MPLPIPLPDSPRKIVYRTLVQILQTDADLSRVIAPNSWYVWTGKPTDLLVMGTANCPIVQITPLAMPARPEAENMQNSPLGIELYIAVFGLNVDDLLDLWSACERPIFTGDGVKAWRDKTQAAFNASPGCAGAAIQTIRLGQPAIQPAVDDQGSKFLTATGTLIVAMTVRK